MKNIHILPTDKPSRLYKHDKLGFKLLAPVEHEIGQYNGSNQHIYITSYENPKKGDYLECDGLISKVIEILDRDKFPYLMDNGKEFARSDSQKIILTDNEDLIKDGVQAFDDEFLKWFVKNPTCEEVEVLKIPYFDESGCSYLLILPKEPKQCNGNILGCIEDKCICKHESIMKPKQEIETIEDAARNYTNWCSENIDCDEESKEEADIRGFIAGAKWQESKMYSKEEVLASFDNLGFKKITSKKLNSLPYQPFITDEDGNIWVIDKEKWFSQFKKNKL